MRLTQGTFSFLPDLSDEQITKQIRYCITNGWSVNVEYTDDPHPRNTYWDRRMSLPHFANARSIRNALDRARLRQANRLFAAGSLTARDLMTIEPADILASRVFTESRPDAGAERGSHPSGASPR